MRKERKAPILRGRDLWARVAVAGVTLLSGCGGDGPSGPRDEPRTLDVEVVDFSYRPDTVNARVGDTIRWIQRDAIPHTVTAGTPAGPRPELFDEPLDQVGAVVEVELTTSGTVSYFCRPHPGMLGTIVIEP
ncbi:MAG: hypothetical protein H0V09_11535 [Gemmatimonadetes bacterium]|nr:hypothetical protein [Gemmatimonadota bacterium]